MRRSVIAFGVVLLLVIGASVYDSLFRAQHPCETCGAEMQQFESGSTVYKCQCGFMVDAGFQR